MSYHWVLSHFLLVIYVYSHHQLHHLNITPSQLGMCNMVILLLSFSRYPNYFHFHFLLYICVLHLHFYSLDFFFLVIILIKKTLFNHLFHGIPIIFWFIFSNISVYYTLIFILCSFFLVIIWTIWALFYYLFKGIPIIFWFIFSNLSIYYIFILHIFYPTSLSTPI